MADKAPDTVSSGALGAAVKSWVWATGVAHKKLSPSDADDMHRLRAEMSADRRRLSATLSTIAPEASAEIEECVARLLHTARGIWQLCPAPTPNAFKTAKEVITRAGRKGRAKTLRAVAFDRAYEAEFAKRRVAWEVNPWFEVTHAAPSIYADLKRQGFKIKQEPAPGTVHRRFQKLAAPRD